MRSGEGASRPRPSVLLGGGVDRDDRRRHGARRPRPGRGASLRALVRGIPRLELRSGRGATPRRQPDRGRRDLRVGTASSRARGRVARGCGVGCRAAARASRGGARAPHDEAGRAHRARRPRPHRGPARRADDPPAGRRGARRRARARPRVARHVGGRVRAAARSLDALEARLAPAGFLRVSRTAIVNLHRVREIAPSFKGGVWVVTDGGASVAVSGAACRRFGPPSASVTTRPVRSRGATARAGSTARRRSGSGTLPRRDDQRPWRPSSSTRSRPSSVKPVRGLRERAGERARLLRRAVRLLGRHAPCGRPLRPEGRRDLQLRDALTSSPVELPPEVRRCSTRAGPDMPVIIDTDAPLHANPWPRHERSRPAASRRWRRRSSASPQAPRRDRGGRPCGHRRPLRLATRSRSWGTCSASRGTTSAALEWSVRCSG